MTSSKKKSENNVFGGYNLSDKPKQPEPSPEDEPQRTLIVGNLADQVEEEVLYELFLQVGIGW